MADLNARSELIEILSIWDVREGVLESLVDHVLANPDVVLRALGGTFIGYRCRNAVERECVGIHKQMRLDDDLAYAIRRDLG